MGIVSGLIVATENGLDLLKAFHRNKGSMSAGVQLSFPQELALVKGVFEYPIYITLAQIDSEFIRDRFPQARQRMSARSVEVKHPPCHGRFSRIDFDSAFQLVVLIADGRTARVDPLFCFFPHPLPDFFFQVFYVIPGHHNLDTMH